MKMSRYANVVRFGALYDILATAPFALPVLSLWALDALIGLDAWLGLGTTFHALDPSAMFFINLGALAYVVWGVARLREPTVANGRLDALLRLLVIGLQLFALSQGATPLLWGLAGVLLVIALLQLRKPAPDQASAARGEVLGY